MDHQHPNVLTTSQLRQVEREQFTLSLVENLNNEQKLAVTLPKESCLVLAGAGSGKTTVIINRITNLVNIGLLPSSIMAVTFTNKAADELKTRLKLKLHREQVADIWAGTFHSLCLRMLRENYELAGLPKNFAVLDMDSQESLIKTLTKDKNVDLISSNENQDDDSDHEKIAAKDVVKFINSKKEFGIKPHEVFSTNTPNEALFVDLYQQYEVACRDQGLLDFSDLLYKTVELLESNFSIKEKYNNQFSCILVDEFQDTNNIQYRWLKAVKGKNAHVMAVGDDDQSIYAFRGANPENMQRFVQEMTCSSHNRDGLVIKLQKNYRSLPYILESANAVIDRNTGRLGKNLWTDSKDNNEKIDIVTYENGSLEARGIAEEINRLVKIDNIPPSEIAVLYRTNMQSRFLEQEVIKFGIPVTVYGGMKFYDRQEIKHVLAYLDLVSSLDRDISFSRVINFPKRGIGETTVEDLRQEAKLNNVSMIEMIARREELLTNFENMPNDGVKMTLAEQKKHKILVEFVGMILDLAECASTCSLSEMVQKIVVETGLKSHYESLGKDEATERLDNIGELISAAKQFELDHPELQNSSLQLPEYLSSVQLLTSTSDADMDKKNTVSLMTVHSAKGLEFDHVFISGLEDGIFPHFRSIEGEEIIDAEAILNSQGKSIEYNSDGTMTEESELALQSIHDNPINKIDSAELQEERRLLYVAITRARKGLIITKAKNRLSMGQETKQKPSRFLSEIPAKRLRFIESKSPYNTFNKFSSSKKKDLDDKSIDSNLPSQETPSAAQDFNKVVQRKLYR